MGRGDRSTRRRRLTGHLLQPLEIGQINMTGQVNVKLSGQRFPHTFSLQFNTAGNALFSSFRKEDLVPIFLQVWKEFYASAFLKCLHSLGLALE